MKYPGTESSTLEFKEGLPGKQQIINTILGFCNLYGGRLVIGVKDDGTVKGVDEDRVDVLIDTVSTSILDSCTPHVLPKIYAQRFGDSLAVVVEVSSGMNKPYFLRSAGMANGTFVRIGNRTVRATPEMIEELQWQSRGRTYDELAVYDASPDDLDRSAIMASLETVKNGSPSDAMLQSYKLVVREHLRAYPSVGGILLFGTDVQKFMPEAFIICTHFAGVGGRKALAARDCTGNLFSQVEDAMDFLTNRLNRSFVIEGRKRREALEVPELALREAVINAVVHRDYNIRGPIKLAIFEDRVEVFSPGIFPGPMDLDHLEAGITYIRNVVIAKSFRAAGYMEKLGTGIVTIFDSYRQRGLRSPQILEGTGFVKCILPRGTSDTSVSAKPVEAPTDRILALFQMADEIATRDVVESLGIPRASAGRYLKQLVEAGVVERQGKGRAARYRMVE